MVWIAEPNISKNKIRIQRHKKQKTEIFTLDPHHRRLVIENIDKAEARPASTMAPIDKPVPELIEDYISLNKVGTGQGKFEFYLYVLPGLR